MEVTLRNATSDGCVEHVTGLIITFLPHQQLGMRQHVVGIQRIKPLCLFPVLEGQLVLSHILLDSGTCRIDRDAVRKHLDHQVQLVHGLHATA